MAAVGSLLAVAALLIAVVIDSTGGSQSPSTASGSDSARGSSQAAAARGSAAARLTTVPILAYQVINVPPTQTNASSNLYVPSDEFAAQMAALKAAGWHAITLDQLQAHWSRGASLGAGKPIVITFDRGYASHYTNALPILKRLGWVGVENLQVNGLSPADGGLSDAQVRGLLSAGWELDTEGITQPDLTALGPTDLSAEVTGARQVLRERYSVPVNSFSYPAGIYDPTVVAAVRAAGFTGATTLVPGWASATADRFRLPRLRVVAGTAPANLLAQIAAAESTTSAPDASRGL